MVLEEADEELEKLVEMEMEIVGVRCCREGLACACRFCRRIITI